MVEIPPQREQTSVPERSAEELYIDALKLKRDLLSSHYVMNALRKNINERIDEIPEDKFSEDEEVKQYEFVKQEYNRRKEVFLNSLGQLPEEENQKVSTLTSLTKVEVALSMLGVGQETTVEPVAPVVPVTPGPVTPESFDQQETVTQPPAQQEQAAERPERETSLEEAERMLKYTTDTGRMIEKTYWEAKVAELQERQEAEAQPDRTPPKGFLQRVKDGFKKAKEAFKQGFKESFDRARGVGPIEQSRTSPLGLRETPPPTPPVADSQETSAQAQETVEAEPVKASKWGWLKERGKGIWNFGIWEFHQAERFRSKTKEAAEDAKALATLIQEERNMTPEAAETEAWEIVNELRSRGLDFYSPDFYRVSNEISERKRKENDDEVEYIIATASNDLLDKLKKYRGEAGQDVLTEENKLAFQADLRTELTKLRNGFEKQYVTNFAEVMRRNLDENWWRRYIWGTAEAALGFAGVKFLTLQIEKAAMAKLLAAEKAGSGTAGAVEKFITTSMDQNVWTTLKEMAQNGPKNLNLDPAELKSLSQKVLEYNHMYEPDWVSNIANGLRSSRMLPQSLPLKIPMEVMSFLGY